MAIGERLRQQREALGMSQDQLAKAVNVSARTIRNIENGMTRRPHGLGKIAAVLGVDLSEQIPAGRESPSLHAASDAQLLQEVAARLAERNDRIRDLEADGR